MFRLTDVPLPPVSVDTSAATRFPESGDGYLDEGNAQRLALRADVERVAQAVSEQVERKRGQDQRDSRPDHELRPRREEVGRLREEAPPACRRQLDAIFTQLTGNVCMIGTQR